MITLIHLHTTLAQIISANRIFQKSPRIQCLIGDGLQHPMVKRQLANVGCVVVIDPILRAWARDPDSHQGLTITAEVGIRVLLNPKVNASETGANRPIYEVMASIADSVLGWQPDSTGDHRFEVAERFIEIKHQDPGLLEYQLTFLKTTALV